MEDTSLAQTPSLTLERFYRVAPEEVWRAWTDPQALARWFGPGKPQAVALAELDVRVGGRLRVLFGGADGREHEVHGVYRQVLPHRLLAFTWTWPRTTPERESQVTILFKATGGGTELDFRHEQLFDEKVRDDHRRGWSGSLDKLAEFLKS